MAPPCPVDPNDSTTTMSMYIMRLYSTDVGRAAAISVMMFIITLIISILLFVSMGDKDEKVLAKQRRQKEREYRKQQKALKGGN